MLTPTHLAYIYEFNLCNYRIESGVIYSLYIIIDLVLLYILSDMVILDAGLIQVVVSLK